jgi:hypothetical protein
VYDRPSWEAALLGVVMLAASHLLALVYERFVQLPWRARRRAAQAEAPG